jgi:uncharacterized protein
MKKAMWIAALVAGLVLPGQAQDKPAAKKLMRVLIVTGRDVAAHNWRETTPVLREHLEKTGEFEVMVCEEPLVLESATALKQYDAVLLNYFNWERPPITDQAKANLLEFVKGGKGLVAFHFSANAWGDWPEYRNLIGRIWTKGSGHGPRGKFNVRIKDKEHFITQGVSDFEADDELYAKLVGDAPIHVLIEADSDWSKGTEPLAWTLDYGKGRVFGYMLGHDAKACRDENFAKLLQRGALWVTRKDAK